MIGRLLETLFVKVRADLSDLSTDLQQGVAQTQRATDQMAQQWTSLSQYADHYGNSLAVMNQRIAQEAAAAGNAFTSVVQPLQTAHANMDRFGRSTGQAHMQTLNLGYQLNDIGMTLASGMNPLTVLIQQGSQVAQIYGGQGGVSALFDDLSRILGGLARKLWPIAAAAVGLGLLNEEIQKSTDVAVTFGDTAKAVFQVLGGYIMEVIDGPLQLLKKAWADITSFIAKWFPVTMNAVIASAVTAVRGIVAAWQLLPGLWNDIWVTLKDVVLDTVEGMINTFVVDFPRDIEPGVNKVIQGMVFAYNAIGAVWENLPSLLGDAMAGAVNFVIDGAEQMANGVIDLLNKVMEGIQALMDFVGADKALEWFGFSGKLNPIPPADLQRWKMETGTAVSDTAADIAAEAAKAFNTNFTNGMMSNNQPVELGGRGAMTNSFDKLKSELEAIMDDAFGTDYMGKFFEDVKDQAIENALKRIAEGTDDVGGAAKKAKKEVDELMEALEDAADNLAGVFTNAFEQIAETGKITFADFIGYLNQAIIKSTSQILGDALSNMFKNLALNSSGGLGGWLAKLGTNLFGGFNAMGGAGVGARAVGGVEMPWRSFIAGENGKELINQDGPAGARRVSTAGRTRQLLSQHQPAPVVNMYIQTPNVESFRQSQPQLAARMGMFLNKGGRNR